MSDLRIQVCDWLGWKVWNGFIIAPDGGAVKGQNKDRPMGPSLLTWPIREEVLEVIPELTLDLMHEAEARLTDEEMVRYATILQRLVNKEWRADIANKPIRASYTLHASAEQRATALLRAAKEKGAA